MKKFEIEILQTLRRVVEIEAHTYEGAKMKVEMLLEQGAIQLERDTEHTDSWIEVDSGKEVQEEKLIDEMEEYER